MTDLVFVSGDFCSGSTLLFTLFRATEEYYCLYEPLHERLLEYLIWPLRTYEHHYFVGNYFEELKRFKRVPELFDPRWGTQDLYLDEHDEADGLYRYLSYLIDEASSRRAKVLIKENRLPFRLAWLKARFPNAKVVHIRRDPESQWKSIVKRGQAQLGREDIGQGSVHFPGFNVARWCEDLKNRFPQLKPECSSSGFERFSKLWQASDDQQRRHADISIDYRTLTHDFEAVCAQLRATLGCEFNLASLRELVVPDGDQAPLANRPRPVRDLIDRAGRKYARLRVRGSG